MVTSIDRFAYSYTHDGMRYFSGWYPKSSSSSSSSSFCRLHRRLVLSMSQTQNFPNMHWKMRIT